MNSKRNSLKKKAQKLTKKVVLLFLKNLGVVCQSKGMTIKDCAIKAGMAANEIYMLKNQRTVTIGKLQTIADAVGWDFRDMIKEELELETSVHAKK